MLKLRPFKIDDVFKVQLDYELPREGRCSLVEHPNIDAFTLEDDDEILAVGGAHIMWPGVAEAWVLVSPSGKQHGRLFARYAKRRFEGMLKENDIRRMQATIHVTDEPAMRFVEWLGFEKEFLIDCMQNAGLKNLYSEVLPHHREELFQIILSAGSKS